MNIADLTDAAAAAPADADVVVLTLDEAAAIAETYTDACERCHVLSKVIAAERRANSRQATEIRERDQLIAQLRGEAEFNRVALAAALSSGVTA